MGIFKYFLVLLTFLMTFPVLGQEGLCFDSPAASSPQVLYATTCAANCAQLYRKSDSESLKIFQNHCLTEAMAERKITLKGALNTAGDVLDRAILRCLPEGAWKTVMAPIELAKALPALMSYLLNGSWIGGTVTTRDVPEEMKACSESPICRRALARNTVRWHRVTSDEDLDKEISHLGFNELFQQAAHDRGLLANECSREIGILRQKISSDGEDWTVQRHQKVYDDLVTHYPHCPGLLKLYPPQEIAQQKQDCLKNSATPLSCLSFEGRINQRMLCEGDEFKKQYREEQIDFCSEVVSFIIPTPLIASKVKVLPKVFKAETKTLNAVEEIVDTGRVVKTTRSAEQNRLIQGYNDKIYATAEENRRFMNAVSSSAVTENKVRVFDVENAAMKKLNTYTNDKELVTSLTNYQKETVLSRVESLKKKYPNMDFEVYSDFKSVKIAAKSSREIDPATHKKLLKDFEDIYMASNKDFSRKMKELGVEVPDAGKAEQWFKAGYGGSVDEAALAARRGRAFSEEKVLDYSTQEVRGKMSERLGQVESLRKNLETSPAMSSLLSSTREGIKIPKEEVFDLVRKNESSEALAVAVSRRYDLKGFSTKDAEMLQSYVRGVDEFSPSILIEKRDVIGMNSELGGASADFLGMGSANLRATAEGLAGKNNLDSALRGAREGEKQVTAVFEKRRESFKKVVGGDVICSGDDCVRVAKKALSENDKIRIMSELAKNPDTRGVRMSFVGQGVPAEARMQLASHGESIEKSFRKQLEGKISFEKLQNLTFGFDMQTVTPHQGTVNLLIGRSSGTRLTVSEEAQLQAAFSKALKDYNKSGAVYGQGTARTQESSFILVPGAGLLRSQIPSEN